MLKQPSKLKKLFAKKELCLQPLPFWMASFASVLSAFVHGTHRIGLSNADLEKLGRLGKECMKVSRRDLAYIVAKGGNGATTVAATMMLAHMVGIEVFVTGGIGGVHRGGETCTLYYLLLC